MRTSYRISYRISHLLLANSDSAPAAAPWLCILPTGPVSAADLALLCLCSRPAPPPAGPATAAGGCRPGSYRPGIAGVCFRTAPTPVGNITTFLHVRAASTLVGKVTPRNHDPHTPCRKLGSVFSQPSLGPMAASHDRFLQRLRITQWQRWHINQWLDPSSMLFKLKKKDTKTSSDVVCARRQWQP